MSDARAAQRRRPLAWRIGLLLGIVVLGVLALEGVVVNRVVSNGFEGVVTAQQQQRLDDAAVTIGERLDRPARLQAFVARIATALGGEVVVITSDGTTTVAFGKRPTGNIATYEAPIEVDGRVIGAVQATLPAAQTVRGFLPLFNVMLIGAGLLSLVGIVLASTAIADRLTRPLRDVAAAARRLERGETTARAAGGDDRESADLADAFNTMADRLERSETLRRRAASDIAHDLATPATVLESQLQAMIDGVVPTDRANLEAARSAAVALSGLVSGLDELATAEAAPLHVRPGAVDVAAAAADAASALEARARDRDVRLRLDVAEGLVAWADATHVARALQNVTSNAIDHSSPGSEVVVSGDRGVTTPASIVIDITDHGPGIAETDVPHVFERFYRADRARVDAASGGRPGGRSAGHGLGLTIARELLIANGGGIAVLRTGPDGTTFRLTLPAAGPAR
ncbi:MAG: HAMP domain-containing sensor histidine kinase [Candidatus Limnocylindrales bacterium]